MAVRGCPQPGWLPTPPLARASLMVCTAGTSDPVRVCARPAQSPWATAPALESSRLTAWKGSSFRTEPLEFQESFQTRA